MDVSSTPTPQLQQVIIQEDLPAKHDILPMAYSSLSWFYLHLFLALLFLDLPPSSSHASFLFGDSLVDTGNNNYLLTLSRADYPPYGVDFAPSGGRPTGRFTNGRTISDLLGEALGESSFPSAFLAPNSNSNLIFEGVNYASGSSGILDETGATFIGRVPLGMQVRYFEGTKGSMIGMVGEISTNEYLKSAVFSITTGSNDILNYLDPSIPLVGGVKVHPTALQDIMVSNLTLHLKSLHELGARKFIVAGIGPLGCIPHVRALMLVTSARCSSVANRLIQGYNMKLSKMIEKLNSEMGPETIFVYANSYNIVLDIIQNHRKYGFENTDDPCCGGSFPLLLCFKGLDKNVSSVFCQNRSKYVFWDAFHPTEATNIIIAKGLLDGGAYASSPITVRELYDYQS